MRRGIDSSRRPSERQGPVGGSPVIVLAAIGIASGRESGYHRQRHNGQGKERNEFHLRGLLWLRHSSAHGETCSPGRDHGLEANLDFLWIFPGDYAARCPGGAAGSIETGRGTRGSEQRTTPERSLLRQPSDVVHLYAADLAVGSPEVGTAAARTAAERCAGLAAGLGRIRQTVMRITPEV